MNSDQDYLLTRLIIQVFVALTLTCVVKTIVAAAIVRTSEYPDVWIAPLDARYDRLGQGVSDFSRIFSSEQKWPAEQHIAVFKFYPAYLGLASSDEIRQAFFFLNSHHVKVAFEASMLSPQNMCSGRLEGDGASATLPILRRIRKLGGRVDYLAMNEPLYHGHHLRDKLCGLSVPEFVANNVKSLILAARELYPDIQIGDVEPMGGALNFKEFSTLFTEWIAAFYRASGTRLSFMHFDIYWPQPWVEALQTVSQEVARSSVPIGVICNGSDLDKSDADWSSSASNHSRVLQSSIMKQKISTIVVQSWVSHPTKFFPASRADTFLGVVSSVSTGTAQR